MIKDAATAVTDRYVMNLQKGVDDLEAIVSVIAAVLNPLQSGLDAVRDGVNVSINREVAQLKRERERQSIENQCSVTVHEWSHRHRWAIFNRLSNLASEL